MSFVTCINAATRDFSGEETNVTVQAGAAEACFSLPLIIVDDDIVEGTEQFLIEVAQTTPPVPMSGGRGRRIMVDILDKDGMQCTIMPC